MNDKERLREAIYATVDDVDQWSSVLRLLAEMTGMIRGTIALRDRETGGIVVPEHVWQGVEHPLLFGWTQNEVDSYINHYMPFDPWIDIERRFHPSKPYASSQYISPQELLSDPFGEWLRPIGISDTVVAEIGLSTPYWVSMNLFFPADNHQTREKALVLLTEFQQTMKDAWRYGMYVRASQSEHSHLRDLLELQPSVGILLDHSGVVVQLNSEGERLLFDPDSPFEDDDGLFLVTSEALAEAFQQAFEDVKDSIGKVSEIVVSDQSYTVSLVSCAQRGDKTGARYGLVLVSIEHRTPKKHPIWEDPRLTKREGQLVKCMAHGGRVTDFIRENQLGKSTGHFHWQNVKKKLKVKDRAEVIARHQVYLQNL